MKYRKFILLIFIALAQSCYSTDTKAPKITYKIENKKLYVFVNDKPAFTHEYDERSGLFSVEKYESPEEEKQDREYYKSILLENTNVEDVNNDGHPDFYFLISLVPRCYVYKLYDKTSNTFKDLMQISSNNNEEPIDQLCGASFTHFNKGYIVDYHRIYYPFDARYDVYKFEKENLFSYYSRIKKSFTGNEKIEAINKVEVHGENGTYINCSESDSLIDLKKGCFVKLNQETTLYLIDGDNLKLVTEKVKTGEKIEIIDIEKKEITDNALNEKALLKIRKNGAIFWLDYYEVKNSLSR